MEDFARLVGDGRDRALAIGGEADSAGFVGQDLGCGPAVTRLSDSAPLSPVSRYSWMSRLFASAINDSTSSSEKSSSEFVPWNVIE